MTRNPRTALALWRRLWQIYLANDLDLIAAGVAFYGLLSVFPAVAALIALFGLVADPVVVESQLTLLSGIMPSDVHALFEAQISRLLLAETATLGWATALSVGLALWSARNGVSALVRGVNTIFATPARGGLRHLLLVLLMTLALTGVAVVALAAVVVAPVALAFLPDGADTARALAGWRWIVALAVLLTGLGMFYRYGPNRAGARLGWLTPGAILALALWLGASTLFSAYLSSMGRYNEVYGSLGAVVALLIWIYLSAYAVLLGAALNMAIYPPGAES